MPSKLDTGFGKRVQVLREKRLASLPIQSWAMVSYDPLGVLDNNNTVKDQVIAFPVDEPDHP